MLVITINGEVFARVRSDQFRPDLASLGADGYLSFRVDFEPSLLPQVGLVIEVRGETNGIALVGSPIILEPPLPSPNGSRQAIADFSGSVDGAEDTQDSFGSLAEQIDGVLPAVTPLHTSANKREPPSKQTRTRGVKAGDSETVLCALVIGPCLPTSRDVGSAAILSNLNALKRLGYAVSFAPTDLDRHDVEGTLQDVTIMARPWYGSVEEVLVRHSDTFDVVILHRAAIAAVYAPLARRHQPSARIFFAVTELLSACLLRQAESGPDLLARGRHEAIMEQRAYEWCDAAITPSRLQAAILRDRVWTDNVHIVPVSVHGRYTYVPFAARSGFAFFGDYGDGSSVAAAVWLVEHIMPTVVAREPSIQCLLVGDAMPDRIRALSSPSLFPLGAVDDVSGVLGRIRLTVAPQNAEARQHILDSMAAGLPCVCTPAAAAGLDLPDPLSELVADDASTIAGLIVRLHADESFHAQCAAAGRVYVDAHASSHAVDAALRLVLGQ